MTHTGHAWCTYLRAVGSAVELAVCEGGRIAEEVKEEEVDHGGVVLDHALPRVLIHGPERVVRRDEQSVLAVGEHPGQHQMHPWRSRGP